MMKTNWPGRRVEPVGRWDGLNNTSPQAGEEQGETAEDESPSRRPQDPNRRRAGCKGRRSGGVGDEGRASLARPPRPGELRRRRRRTRLAVTVGTPRPGPAAGGRRLPGRLAAFADHYEMSF